MTFFHSSTRQTARLFRTAKRLACADRYDGALVALDQAIAHAPTAQIYDYRGVLLSLTLQNEAALESFASALELAEEERERAEIHFHRGLHYGRDQLYEQALQDFIRACQFNRADPTYREARDTTRKYHEAHNMPA